MQELKKRVFTQVQYAYNAGQMNPEDTSWTNFCELITDTILKTLTLPTVKLKCQEKDCVNGSIRKAGEFYTKPCTCTNGERKYRRVWDKDVETGMMIPLTPVLPLTYPDLGDPDVADAYASLMKLKNYTKMCVIENNKGTLRLIEKEV